MGVNDKLLDNSLSFLNSAAADLRPRRILIAFMVMIIFSAAIGLAVVKIMPHSTELRQGWWVSQVEYWVTKDGFAKNSGMVVYQGLDESKRYIYKTSAPWGYYPIYAAQKIIYMVRGKYGGDKVWLAQNIALWILTASCIGIITFMLISKNSRIRLYYSLIIGLCACMVFLLHSVMLYQIRVITHAQIAIFICLYIIALETYLAHINKKSKLRFLTPLLVFCLFGASIEIAVLFFISRILFALVNSLNKKEIYRCLYIYVLPAALAVILGQLQLYYALHFNDAISGKVGSTFLQRAGLDGATDYINGTHLDLFTARIPIVNWYSYFIVGVVTFMALLIISFWDKKVRPLSPVIFPFIMMGILFSFVFVEGYYIHRDFYDPIWLIGFTLSIYCFLGGWLYRRVKYKYNLIYFIVALSIAFVMVHLRYYALQFPQPDGWYYAITTNLPPSD